MAGLESLKELIFFEKQESGSMLCAQHALNSLLQGEYFSAADLAEIAHALDNLEQSYDHDNNGEASMNMDDTGFFSVQVIENALKALGLNLERWRSQAMAAYQDRPHTQLAFILNYHQHWYTIRRFGQAFSDVDMDPGVGHWFNLNSFNAEPEWVSKLYLGMVLQQAEADGYSVFAIAQGDPSAALALPRTVADDVAATLPEATSSGIRTNSAALSLPADNASMREDFADEDFELQAALHQSLMGGGYGDEELPPLPHASIPLPTFSEPDSASRTPMSVGPSSTLPEDPVEASMERNRRMLERMRQEQQSAQQDLWDGGMRPNTRANDEEDSELQRVLAMSAAESGDVNAPESSVSPSHFGGGGGFEHERVYDDDDAELQAALKASLEGVPSGWTPPSNSHPLAQSRPSELSVQASPQDDKEKEQVAENDDVETETCDDTPAADATPQAAKEPDIDEMRRKRLARFGG